MKSWKIHLMWAVVAIVLAAGFSRAMISRREAAFRERERELEKTIRELKVRRSGPAEARTAARSEGEGRGNAAVEDSTPGEDAVAAAAAAEEAAAKKKKPKKPKGPPTADEIRALLNSKSRNDRRKAIDAIRKLKDKGQQVALLREALKVGDNDTKYRAVMLFDEIGPPEGTMLALEVLQSGESGWLRGRAARELSQIRDPQTIAALQNAFLDSDPSLKYWSAKALQAMGWEEPVRQLVASTAPGVNDPDGALRERTVERLGYLGSADALPYLDQALNDPNSRVRREALQSLGNTNLPQAIPIIQRGLNDPRSSVREEAVDALYDIGGRDVLPLLNAALNDSDSGVVRRAQRAIERIEKKLAQ